MKPKPFVLFVEDNTEIVDLLQEIAPSSPIQACFAYSSAEALQIYKETSPKFAAILVDRRLPDLHGDLLARELRGLGFKGLLACYSSDRVDALDPNYDTSFRKSEPVFQVLRRLDQLLCSPELKAESQESIAQDNLQVSPEKDF